MAEPVPPTPTPPDRGGPHPAVLAAGALAAGALAVGVVYVLARLVAAHWPWFVALLAVAVLITAGVLWTRLQARREAERLRELAHLSRIDSMSGAEFEDLVARLLRRDGYRSVQVVGRAGDRGVDVTALTSDRREIAVQCKRQQKKVGSDRVRNLVGAVHGGYAGCVGVLVTNAYFTKPALDERGRLVLIDRDALGRWLDGEPLRL